MKIKIIRNDISNMKVDAIVLPANEWLKIGSGTSKAIFDKAGKKELEAACRKIGYTKAGHTVVTKGYGLDARLILHSVVPKWKDGKHKELEKLSAAYLSALALADDLDCQSVAIPVLGSGNNGFDQEIAFEIARESIDCFEPHKGLTDIYLVVYSTEMVTMLKNKDVYVEELIDGLYVTNNNEHHVPSAQKLLEIGKDVTEYAMEHALKLLEEPENREKLNELARMCVERLVNAL